VSGPLHTAVHVKRDDADDFPAGDERVCYVVTADGLFIGRDADLGPGARFRSLVPAPAPPAELARQAPRLSLRYPRLGRDLLARIVSFFRRVAERDGGEAIVLLALDRRDGRLEPIVPPQRGTVGRRWGGGTYPIDLRYELDEPVGPDRVVVGDVHSHVYEAAYASSIDTADERHAPGLHLVAGRLDRPHPAWWAEFVVDGHRFEVPPHRVLDLGPDPLPDTDVPPEWLDRVHTTLSGGWTGGTDGRYAS
jgi:proteasome lid subunit RPN8/RPN11